MLLDPDVINLNTGSFGPLPRPVFDRVTELRQRLAAEPMDFLVRQRPAAAVARPASGWPPSSAAIPRAAGLHRQRHAAINLVASSLPLSSPGEILLTDHEYGAMHWCWERAARRLG